MRTCHRLAGGQFRVWWLTHQHQATAAAGVCFVVFAFGLVGSWDYQDALAVEELKAKRLAECEQGLAAQGLPSTVYVIEANTPEKAQAKLRGVANSLDRYRSPLYVQENSRAKH